ncbi:MAG: carbonic anhydrase [Chloroflexota bacterium]
MAQPDPRPAGAVRPFGRRRFFELAGTAGAAAVLATGLNLGISKVPSLFAAGGDVEALVLTCMDFRLVNEVGFLLNEHGLVNKYDQIILAGATLGVATDKYPHWAQTFWDHLDLAIKLHSIKRVIAVDHRDCGAFKLVLGKDYGKLPDEETQIHTKVMTDFRDMVKKKQPNVEVELLLMWLDGHVQPIGDGAPAGMAAPASAPARH